MLAEAIISGHLYLNEGIPVDENSPNSDGADSRHNFKRFLDASERDGKYYLRHDPFPVVFHFPSLLIAGARFPGGLVVIAASFGCLLLVAAILKKTQDRFYSDSPAWPRWYVTAMFALSGSQLYIVSRPLIYHESIALAAFWAPAAYLLIGSIFRGERRGFC